MASTREIAIFPSSSNLFHAAADEFIKVARTAIGAQGRFCVALAGGSTPKGLYDLLATNYSDFAWNRVFLFFGDERYVSPSSPESNFRMVNETLISKIKIPGENVFRVLTEDHDAPSAAADYDSRLQKFFDLKSGAFPRFDLILLGMGPDGHTASLFPESEGLKERNRLVIANWVEKFKANRITLTFPVLNRASEILFLVSGADKALVLAQVLQGKSDAQFPAQGVHPSEGKVLWMLDEAAAAKLPR